MINNDTARRRYGALRRRLHARLPLEDEMITLPRAQAKYIMSRPTTFERLLDAAAADPEEQVPYWAVIWASGIALADAVLMEPAKLANQRVLELGAGLGVTACAALAAGAQLVVTDYSADTLLLCRLNTLRNVQREPEALRINWRQPSRALLMLATPPFPIVLAADVLYESRDVEPLLRLAEHILAPGGLLWLAEPRRPVAGHFVTAATDKGWDHQWSQHHGPWPDPKDAGVTVNLHRLRRPDKTT